MINRSPEIDKMTANSVTTETKSMETEKIDDDLEDGEIESDGETALTIPETVKEKIVEKVDENVQLGHDVHGRANDFLPKSKNRKNKKSNRDRERDRNRDRSSRNVKAPCEDDWATNVQNAIANAINKDIGDLQVPKASSADEKSDGKSDIDKRKTKKRKRNANDKESRKKRKHKHTEGDEGVVPSEESLDEDELLGIRGASPRSKYEDVLPQQVDYNSEYDSYASENSYDSDPYNHRRGGNFDDRRKHRNNRRDGSRRQNDRKSGKRRGDTVRDQQRELCHPLQDPEGVCLFYMQGKCQRGEDCPYSHDGEPQRKMELCKFYLMECCAKRDKCLYMHSDFPCKYYHTGFKKCNQKECKFAHGKPLSAELKAILIKHIETAPKEILGDFPRINRDGVSNMVNTTQAKLLEQMSPKGMVSTTPAIPSLFDLTIPKPQGLSEGHRLDLSHHDKPHSKNRKTRWCDADNATSTITSSMQMSMSGSSGMYQNTSNYLSIQNLTGVLSPHQITELISLGIQNLDQLSQLTVKQLNQIGLTMSQINEIQLNTLNIQKLGLTNSGQAKSGFYSNATIKDMDMRRPQQVPMVSPTACVKDIDMRIHSGPKEFKTKEDDSFDLRTDRLAEESNKPEEYQQIPSLSPSLPPVIDYDQYAKDALKYQNFGKESEDENKEECEKSSEQPANEPKPLFDLNQYIKDSKVNLDSEKDDFTKTDEASNDSKDRMPYERQRSSHSTATEDEAPLEIDESWYSTDEENSQDKKQTEETPAAPVAPVADDLLPTLPPEIMQPSKILDNLGENVTVDISESVAKLLTSIQAIERSSSIRRDPLENLNKTTDVKTSPVRRSSDESDSKSDTEATLSRKISQGNSIYDCPSDSEEYDDKKDVDLRQDQDMRYSTFGDMDLRYREQYEDTDLRNNRDTDLRLNVDRRFSHYAPATEIDASIKTHAPIQYKVHLVDIPKPDFREIKRNTPKTSAANDPRLRKIFRFIENDNDSGPEESKAPASPTPEKKPRVDPRRRTETIVEIPTKPTPAANVLDIQVILQTNDWYKELSTNQKIMVNQQLAALSTLIKQYNADKKSDKVFDVSVVHNNHILASILTNLGIYINDEAQFNYLKDVSGSIRPAQPMANMLMAANALGSNLGNILPNIGPMGSMQSVSMGAGGFDPRYQTVDPRGAPGILGMAPNAPHNYDNQFENYGMDNQGFNEEFNVNQSGSYSNYGPGGGQYDGSNNYYRNPNGRKRNFSHGGAHTFRGGRNNDRWGGSRGGHNRDGGRRNFLDRDRGGGHREHRERPNSRRDKGGKN